MRVNCNEKKDRQKETNRKRDNRRKTSKLQIFRPYRHRQGRRRKFFARITIGKDGDANPSPVSSSARPMTQILRPYPRRQSRRRKSFARIAIGKDGDANPSPVLSSAKPAMQILRPYRRRQSRRHKSFSCFIRRRSKSRRSRQVHHRHPGTAGTTPALSQPSRPKPTHRSVAARPKPPAEATSRQHHGVGKKMHQLLFNKAGDHQLAIYGHITLTAPYPVRSVKLSRVKSG